MRIPFVCGNWKMHKTVGEAVALVDGILAEASALAGVEIGIAPPHTALHPVVKRTVGSKLRVAAQNVHAEPQGAFTGEISVPMLSELGCHYVLVGHSERRALFGETDESCAQKVGAVLSGGLRAILCVGEQLSERESGAALEVVTRQVEMGLSTVSEDQISDIVVAYEPVWAIGTGRTASPEQAQEVHAHIRQVVGARFSPAAAAGLRIQYGGSVKPNNAADLFGQPDIDGGLIGGAALNASDFLAICRAACSL